MKKIFCSYIFSFINETFYSESLSLSSYFFHVFSFIHEMSKLEIKLFLLLPALLHCHFPPIKHYMHRHMNKLIYFRCIFVLQAGTILLKAKTACTSITLFFYIKLVSLQYCLPHHLNLAFFVLILAHLSVFPL